MRERLFAWGLALQLGLMPYAEYSAALDALFLSSDDPLLLELEMMPADSKDALAKLLSLCDGSLDADAVADILFPLLEDKYRCTDVRAFSQLSPQLSRLLPFDWTIRPPFCDFIWADEPLDWGDEAQAKALYERALRRDPQEPPVSLRYPGDAPRVFPRLLRRISARLRRPKG